MYILGQGVHYIGVIISDKWGAEYKYTPSQSKREIIVDPPSVSATGAGNNEGANEQLEAAKASGDKSALLMFLQAQSEMLSQASTSGNSNSGTGNSASEAGSIPGGSSIGIGVEPGLHGGGESDTGMEEGPNSKSDQSESGSVESQNTDKDAEKAAAEAKEAKAEEAATVQGNIKVDQISAVQETGGGKVNDIAGAEVMSKTIETIIGKPAQEGEKSALGQEVVKRTTSLLDELVSSMAGLTDFADPEQIKPSVTSVTNTIGTLLDAMYAMSKNPGGDLDEVAIKNDENEVEKENDEIR